mmetsp:Transcript_1797/g.4145  ORF Transcript_1797/g.4145 Transcript_1797/m.4145 type:complete len:333 (-) Transcript_1797:752-1750(-)
MSHKFTFAAPGHRRRTTTRRSRSQKRKSQSQVAVVVVDSIVVIPSLLLIVTLIFLVQSHHYHHHHHQLPIPTLPTTQAMDLSRFPRRKYTPYVTPIEPMTTLSSRLSPGGTAIGGTGVNLWIKRDDMLGLTGGGNKTRKLEFAMADAIINHGADTIVTCGAVQSNHCRLTLSACVKEGLKCVLVLEERVPGSYKQDASGNHYLFNLLGAENIFVVGLGEAPAKVQEIATELREKQGRNVYCVPGGASNEIGALGYCSCAAEIQVRRWFLRVHVVCCSSPSSTALLPKSHAAITLIIDQNSVSVFSAKLISRLLLFFSLQSYSLTLTHTHTHK